MLFQAIQKAYNSNPNPRPVYFDVGTNAGSFVAALNDARRPHIVHCFEPHPVLADKVSSLYPHVIMNKCCVGNSNNDIIINIPMWSCGISSVIDRPVFSQLNQDIVKLQTKCTTLDTYCATNNIDTIDFIKVDVEGAEKMVFEGAATLLANKKIKAGIFEIGQTLVDAGSSTEEICNLISGYGYRLDRSLSPNDVFFHI